MISRNFSFFWKKFNIILACTDETQLIGRELISNEEETKFVLPWGFCTPDMRHFQSKTTGGGNNAIIMGHNTWHSIPKDIKPLKDRFNIVISRDFEESLLPNSERKNFKVFRFLEDAFSFCAAKKDMEEIFIIGGSNIYKKCFLHHKNLIDKIYVTLIPEKYSTGTQYEERFKIKSEIYLSHINFSDKKKNYENNYKAEKEEIVPWKRYNTTIKILTLSVRNNEENAYLNLLKDVLVHGEEKEDRTGVGTLSLFGKTLEFDLSSGIIPLLTTKKIFFRGSVEEMLFFISGKTDASILDKKQVRIWNDNTTREFLDSRNLKHYEEYDMGPTYGFLFRHCGAEGSYKGKDEDYENQGFDQLAEVIRLIRDQPSSRRIMINLWSAAHSDKMSLPPCLFNYIFNVNIKKNEVSLMITMRSADLFLGVPFNLCGASLILRMICHITGRKPGRLILNIGDAHIYKNQIVQARTQIVREPNSFPRLSFKRSPEELENNIHNFVYEDFILKDYAPQGILKAHMAV